MGLIVSAGAERGRVSETLHLLPMTQPVTVTDTFSMPMIDDLIDEVSGAELFTKIDLLKGFYLVPLWDRARKAFASVAIDELYEYPVMLRDEGKPQHFLEDDEKLSEGSDRNQNPC